MGDSLLRGTEDPVCQPDPPHREVCYLPGGQARDIAGRLSGLIQPTDCCPLLVVLVGRDEVDEKSTWLTKKDFKALSCLAEGTRAEVVVLIPLVVGMNAKMNRKTHGMKKWLKDWCHWWNFGFFGPEVVCMAPGWRQMGFTSLEEAKGFQPVSWQG